jgi:hypothetical protein
MADSPGSGRVFLALIAVAIVGLLFFFAYARDRAAAVPFSADEYMLKALVAAQRAAPDAEIELARAEMIDAAGKVEPAQGGLLVAQFRSPSRDRAAAEPVMLGAKVKNAGACRRLVSVAALRVGIKARRFEFETKWREDPARCGPSLPEPLHCTFAAIWARAIADGAPQPALATIKLSTVEEKNTLARVWVFTITDHRTSTDVFRRVFADDCRGR